MPALAVADALSGRGAEVSFLGAAGRAESEIVPAAGYEIELLKLRGLDRGHPIRAAGALGLAAAAVPAAPPRFASARRARSSAAAATSPRPPASPRSRSGLPLVLTEADRHLGMTNRLLARRARRVCLAFPIDGREGER